jgi:magnesium transporter
MVEGRIAFGETHLFVGRGYVVSVRHGASVSYAAVRQRCEACPTVLSQGEDYIVYAILDFIVDNFGRTHRHCRNLRNEFRAHART